MQNIFKFTLEYIVSLLNVETLITALFTLGKYQRVKICKLLLWMHLQDNIVIKEGAKNVEKCKSKSNNVSMQTKFLNYLKLN